MNHEPFNLECFFCEETVLGHEGVYFLAKEDRFRCLCIHNECLENLGEIYFGYTVLCSGEGCKEDVSKNSYARLRLNHFVKAHWCRSCYDREIGLEF